MVVEWLNWCAGALITQYSKDALYPERDDVHYHRRADGDCMLRHRCCRCLRTNCHRTTNPIRCHIRSHRPRQSRRRPTNRPADCWLCRTWTTAITPMTTMTTMMTTTTTTTRTTTYAAVQCDCCPDPIACDDGRPAVASRWAPQHTSMLACRWAGAAVAAECDCWRRRMQCCHRCRHRHRHHPDRSRTDEWYRLQFYDVIVWRSSAPM